MLHTETIILSVRKLIETLSQKVDNELQTFLQLEPMLSAGFLQHYGMPTELLDVTSSLGVAAFFASFGKVESKGVLCVFPVDNVASKSIIIDLTQHPYAERPRRQAAYAFYHHTFRDIKDSKCIDELKLDWFEFTLQETDIIKYQIRKDLLDAHNDKVAGVLQLILDDFEKLDDSAAHWLADRVAPAPFVARVIDYWEQLPNQPKTVELVSLADAGLPYDEQCERENNYKKWSAAFPESRPHKLKPDTGMEPMR